MNDSSVKSIGPYLISIVVMLMVSVLYFFPQFQGKVLQQSDLVNYQWMSQESKEYQKTSGEETLWTNSMFGGMPTYQIGSKEPTNVNKKIYKIMRLGIPRPAGLFFLGSLCFFLMMIGFRVNVWIALITSLAFAFTTNNLVLFDAGHATKVIAIMVSPLVVGGAVLTYQKKWLIGFPMFALGMGLNLMANHYQMTYYLALCMLFLVIGYLIERIIANDLINFLKSSVLLLFGVVLAFGTSASKLMTTYEYMEDTMRGESILKNTDDEFSSSGVDGLSYDYAMSWSNGWGDLLASYIPKVVGGSSGEMVKSSSDLGKALKRRGVPMNKGGIQIGTYWGALPFTSGPIYFGAIMFFLFILGSLIVKGNVKYFLVLSTILTLLLSMGQNLDWLSSFFFDYVPMYNKFRTPNSILSVTAIFIPLLAGLALHEISKNRDGDWLNKVYISAGLTGGLALLLALLGPSIFDFSSAGDVRYEQAGFDVSLFEDHRIQMLRSSCFRSFIFIALTSLLLFAYHKFGAKMSTLFLMLSIGILSMIDIMPINVSYLSGDSFMNQRKNKAAFEPRAVDRQILNDKELYYRVHDVSINSFNSAQASYFHKTVGGYHAAKLQRYQDIIDVYLSKNNEKVLNMLNTKYIIGNGQNGEPQVSLNTAAQGNAWFVNTIRTVGSPKEEIEMINNIDPRGEAIVHSEFAAQMSSTSFNQQGSIQLTSYAPNKLTYKVQTDSPQFAIFSDIWYGPDKGWNAYLNGELVPHLRANYILRAMNIPAGNHSLEFKFEPKLFQLGKTIALISSIILSILLLMTIALLVKPSLLGDRFKAKEQQ